MDMNIEIPQRYNFIVFSNNIFTCDTNGNLHLEEVANPELESIFFSSDYTKAEDRNWNQFYIYLGQSLKNNECFLALEIQRNELEQANETFFVIYKDRNFRYNIKKINEANDVLTQEQCQRLFAKMIDIYKQQINGK